MGCAQSQENAVQSALLGKSFKLYGRGLFKGSVAAPYLEAVGLPTYTLQGTLWAKKPPVADLVAKAVLMWARDNGASAYCHWFQPLASSGVRHGMSGQVQNLMYHFAKDGSLVWEFTGSNLLKSETDGSSYPNGGLRQTSQAGAYLSIDPTSPIFLRGDCIFIPACLIAWTGMPLDEKTPLLRSVDALSKHGKKLLSQLGFEVSGLVSNIGLEQEFFLIPREAYLKRPDLMMTGRTVLGKMSARGQEMSDHYMSPISTTSPALACMMEIQDQCYKIGIPLRTRHREVAPNQYEFAPLYGFVTTQIDQNLLVMQIIEEVAAKHNLAALFQEKPFQGVNGSGKHNNWSIGTKDGKTNLLNVGELAKNSGNADIFPIIMACLVKAVGTYGDLMRMSIAPPGNDFRLGACEAPPAIISMYLGDSMTKYLEAYKDGKANASYNPKSTKAPVGATAVPDVTVPPEDRNRTSPFPYGGHRFEFRAVGSSQNVSLVNTVLNTITAKSFKDFADALDWVEPERALEEARSLARKALSENWHHIFNGNGYDPENQAMLTERGNWRIDSGVDAIARYTDQKNLDLFDDLGVLTNEDCRARRTVLLKHYVGTVEMEANCMLEMIEKHVVPSCVKANYGTWDLSWCINALKSGLYYIHDCEDEVEQANLARVLRLETMMKIRQHVDAAEEWVPAGLWTLATYEELLFLDQTLPKGK